MGVAYFFHFFFLNKHENFCRKSIALTEKSTLNVSSTADLICDRFGPFSLARCLQEFPMFLTKFKGDSFNFAARSLLTTSGQTDILKSIQD